MNIEKLVAAATEIDDLAVKQEEKSKRLQEIARLVRGASGRGDHHEVRRLQNESRQLNCTVVDFGNAVNDLRKALHARK